MHHDVLKESCTLSYIGGCLLELPVPFLPAFIFSVLPPGTHSLLGEQSASTQSRPRVRLETKTFRTGIMRSNRFPILPTIVLLFVFSTIVHCATVLLFYTLYYCSIALSCYYTVVMCLTQTLQIKIIYFL